MKPQTQSFYEQIVRDAIAAISRQLDADLDLARLARGAALSPLHFHRIFSGMVGETPLEQHRRLRLERAATRLLDRGARVTEVALEAGYEAHEAFTRAFRVAYGTAPSLFRAQADARRHRCELPSPSGVHFEGSLSNFAPCVETLEVEVVRRPRLRVATVRHVGPYQTIFEAFLRLHQGVATLAPRRGAELLAVYLDDPEGTPVEELRSDAGITLSAKRRIPAGLRERWLKGGRHARHRHVGPYSALGDAWARFMGRWLPTSNEQLDGGAAYEVYRNDPSVAPPQALVTDLYLPLL